MSDQILTKTITLSKPNNIETQTAKENTRCWKYRYKSMSLHREKERDREKLSLSRKKEKITFTSKMNDIEMQKPDDIEGEN